MLHGTSKDKRGSKTRKMPVTKFISISRQIHLAKKKRIVKDRTNEFLHDEIAEIEKHKWIESEKAKHDLGNQCCLEWIKEYAAMYRILWEQRNGKVVEEIEIDDGINCSGS